VSLVLTHDELNRLRRSDRARAVFETQYKFYVSAHCHVASENVRFSRVPDDGKSLVKRNRIIRINQLPNKMTRSSLKVPGRDLRKLARLPGVYCKLAGSSVGWVIQPTNQDVRGVPLLPAWYEYLLNLFLGFQVPDRFLPEVSFELGLSV
jgi:hypothetical protein